MKRWQRMNWNMPGRNGRAWCWAGFVLALIPALFVGASLAPARPLIADLSSNVIAITTQFSGSQVLLFGAVEEAGDVVVVVRGPGRRAIVRRKDRVLGVWINHKGFTFEDVPTFYAVASSRPLTELAPASVRARYRIGVDQLRFPTDEQTTPAEIKEFRRALIQRKQANDLYARSVGEVRFLGKRLFRTDLHFPANVSTGSYTAEIYLMRGGEVVSVQSTPIVVRRVGLEAEVFGFAHRQPALYGLIAIAMAVAAGWFAAVIFRRV
jgi:uncharacterized protein (TIGR02186 family)